jgi:hypothetical protein
MSKSTGYALSSREFLNWRLSTEHLIEDQSDEIDNPDDALEQMPQQQLLEYSVEVGYVEETCIFQAIRERMHRDL